MSHKKIRIIGGGLAGQILAWKLYFLNVDFEIWDEDYNRRPSNVAAGIMNPITGRRFALSWKFPDLMDAALAFYRKVEKALGRSLVREVDLYRAIPSDRLAQEWDLKSTEPGVSTYVGELVTADLLSGHWQSESAWYGRVIGAHQLDIKGFCQASAAFWEEQGRLISDKFVLRDPHPCAPILMAEGVHGSLVGGSWLNALHRTKGDVLLIRCPKWPETRLVKDSHFMCPLFERDMFWVGSQYQHGARSDVPDPAWRQKFERFLQERLLLPYEIVDHISAYRPTVVDRKPIVGRLTTQSNVYVFNGLGTKGATLGPWSADRLLRYLLGGEALESSIDIRRFED